MTSIILVHTFAPHPDEHYTALPAEEGQPVSYVRRIVVEGTPVQALGLSSGFLKAGEQVADTFELPNSGSEQVAPTPNTKPEPKPAPAKSKAKPEINGRAGQ